ncbi:MAG: glutamate synthase-related protein [bacterium]
MAAGVAKAGADSGGGRLQRRHRRLAALVHPPRGRAGELGWPEVQQVLRANGLRISRARAGGRGCARRDVVVSALLGAEFGFATAALVSRGACCQQCHQNTCSTGIATQDPRLRARFTGRPSRWCGSSSSRRSRCGATWPRWASARWRRPSGGWSRLAPAVPESAKAQALIRWPLLAEPPVASARFARVSSRGTMPPTPGSTVTVDGRLIPRPGCSLAETDPQRGSGRRRAPQRRDRPPARLPGLPEDRS